MEFIEWIKQSWIYIAAIGGGLTVLLNLSKNLSQVKELLTKPEREQNARIAETEDFIKLLKDERQQYLNNVKHWSEHESSASASFKNINNALTALIRDRIHGYYFRKCTEKGYITPVELEIVEELYKNYEKMGGNGMIKKEMEILRNMPMHE